MENAKPSSNTPLTAPVIFLATLSASLPLAVRSDQSLSMMKPMPIFCPLPLKLKPDTVITSLTSGMFLATPTNVLRAFSVRSCVAPVGSCRLVMIKPWSSPGKKDVGSFLIITTATAIMPK